MYCSFAKRNIYLTVRCCMVMVVRHVAILIILACHTNHALHFSKLSSLGLCTVLMFAKFQFRTNFQKNWRSHNFAHLVKLNKFILV